MWESLATTRRQDRVLHGAAKAVNLVFGLAMVPLWIAGQRVAGWLGRLLSRFASPSPLPTPPAGDRSLDTLLEDLRSIPHNLRPTRTATIRRGLADLTMFLLAQKRQTVNLGYDLPSQFRYVNLEGADGERIAAEVAVHDTPRPGLVVVHGLFSSRRFDYVREVAVRAYYDWGFNVAVLDLRSFGLTEMLTRAPGTAGWKEGEDILCVARHLKSQGATGVGAIGFSLGASSAMNASHLEGAEDELAGGVLSVSGPTDTRLAAGYLDRKVSPRHPFFLVSHAFDTMLLSKVRNLGWPSDVAGFATLIELVVAPHYGVTVDEVYERSSAKNHIHAARVPVLALHAEDDEVVPVEHARMLEEAAAGSDNVRVWIVPGGGHAAFDAVDRTWTYAVYRKFFERLAQYP